MSRVLIIGAGGVSSVVVHKCCQNPDVFTDILLASRTLAKCDAIKASLDGCRPRILTAQVNADQTGELIALIQKFQPELVINVALPYQDLTIMDACLATGVDYLDTANYESPETPKFEYKWQWAYRQRFAGAGIMALLGCGFDPGVTGVFCAYAQKHYFDEIHTIDILDANAGDHGLPFATNFNPEINIREITAKGSYYEDGRQIETEPLAIRQPYDFPEIGVKNIYLLHHEEIESLAQNIKGVRRIRFWMTFSDNYLNHLRVLQNVGMTSIRPIEFEGRPIIPLQFLKAVLPDPASLGPRTKGKTNIGCIFTGVKDGRPRRYYVYNVCDHQACYAEVGSQAISYTTGVPAMIGAMMMLKGIWKKPGVFNVEEFDPDPFMDALNRNGLPWQESFDPVLPD
ncbi:MAG TPA: saccharopine dehydrogenase [Clostridiales bacterium]|nr:saccharopine dehydrogenase [Clostridiales bacterium]